MKKWKTGMILSFQQNLNTNFWSVVRYSCEDRKVINRPWYSKPAFVPSRQKLYQCVNLRNIKRKAGTKVEPHRVKRKTCFLMLLSNLAEPDWISVSCKRNILHVIICEASNNANNTFNEENLEDKISYCSLIYTKFRNKCISFKWLCKISLKKLQCRNENVISVPTITAIIQSILGAVSLNEYPLFHFCSKSKQISRYKYERYLNIFQQSVTKVKENRQEGFYTYIENKNTTFTSRRLFQWGNEFYILHSQVCNGKTECHGEEDEKFCICDKDQNFSKNIFCNVSPIIYKQRLCSPLYYITVQGSCHQVNRLSFYLKNSKPESGKNNSLSLKKFTENEFLFQDNNNFICNDGTILDLSLVDDLEADCGPEGEDEPILLSILVNRTSYSCTKKYELPCRQDHSKCYSLQDICTYKLNRFHHITPCRNGEHIQNCTSAVCNMRFKCELAYCIPWNYVCNGRWDCPSGEDEIWYDVCNKRQVCKHMYKCKNTKQICIHLGSVCNNQEECPLGDDELFCDLKDCECIPSCHCLLFGLFCIETELSTKYNNFLYLSVHITNSKIHYLSTLVDSMKKYTVIVRMPNNNIKDLFQFCYLRNTTLLDLGHNYLKRLLKNCFSSFHLLRSLSVNDNYIEFIESEALQNILHLKFLNISNNPLYNLPQNILKRSNNFKYLILYGFYLIDIDTNAFNEHNIKIILTSDYYVCCISPTNVICTASKPWYIYCSDILPKYSIKILFKVASILIFVSNIGSIVIHLVAKKSTMSFKITIIFLNITNLLCFSYMAIIWISDVKLQSVFAVKQKEWRSGFTCFAAFGTQLWFTLLSQIVLLFLSLSRLIVVINPLTSKLKRTKLITQISTSIFIVTFSFVGFISKINKMPQIHNNLCLPFVDPTMSSLMVKVIAWSTGGTQIVTSVLLSLIHILIIKNVKDSQKNIGQYKSKQNSTTSLAIQLFILTITNILGWLTSSAVYISTMFQSTYSNDLIMFTAGLALPFGTIMNPVIFITVSLRQ